MSSSEGGVRFKRTSNIIFGVHGAFSFYNFPFCVLRKFFFTLFMRCDVCMHLSFVFMFVFGNSLFFCFFPYSTGIFHLDFATAKTNVNWTRAFILVVSTFVPILNAWYFSLSFSFDSFILTLAHLNDICNCMWDELWHIPFSYLHLFFERGVRAFGCRWLFSSTLPCFAFVRAHVRLSIFFSVQASCVLCHFTFAGYLHLRSFCMWNVNQPILTLVRISHVAFKF